MCKFLKILADYLAKSLKYPLYSINKDDKVLIID